jgi:hypothetical protein
MEGAQEAKSLRIQKLALLQWLMSIPSSNRTWLSQKKLQQSVV